MGMGEGGGLDTEARASGLAVRYQELTKHPLADTIPHQTKYTR